MAGGPDPWDIGDLADLILGPRPQRPQRTPPAGNPAVEPAATPSAPAPDAVVPAPPRAGLVLVNVAQDAIASVTRYADYCADRGETVAAFWVGQTGIKVGLFDCSGQRGWTRDILDNLEPLDGTRLAGLLAERCDRIMVTLVTGPGWTASPFLSLRSACVLVEAAPVQLVGSYDALRELCSDGVQRMLSCFVLDAPSASAAQRLAERFYRLGDQFLDHAIGCDGFALAEAGPSNTVAEAYVPADRAPALTSLLADWLQSAPPPVPSATAAPAAVQAVHAACDDDDLPRLNWLPVTVRLSSAEDVDRLARDGTAVLCPGAVESWPALTAPRDGCCLRWIRREDGGRTLVVSTVGATTNALEHAGACLFPKEPGDAVVVLAPVITPDLRRAASALQVPARLLELARPPRDVPRGVLLRDVTSEC